MLSVLRSVVIERGQSQAVGMSGMDSISVCSAGTYHDHGVSLYIRAVRIRSVQQPRGAVRL